MTYLQLRTAVQSRLDRPDEGAAIAVCVEAATARLTRLLRVYEQEAIADATLTTEYSALPADFNGMRSLSAGGKKLDYRAPQFFQAEASGEPSLSKPIFTIEASSLRVYPAPSVASPLAVTLLYSRKLAALVADGDTNDALNEHPDLYLAAVMAELMLHMKNYDTHAVWESRTAQMAAEVVLASRRKRYSGGNLVVRNGS
jgi:hypothetical protein